MPEAPAGLSHPRHWPIWFAAGLLRLFSLLPLPVLWLAGGLLGEIMYRVAARDRRVALKNIELCFPALAAPARRRLVRRHFRLAGQSLLALGLAWWAGRRRLRRLVRLTNRAYFDRAATGPVILLAPHFLGMEMGGLRLALERDCVSMYKRAKNPVLEHFFQRRTRYSGRIFERSAQLRDLIRCIQAGMPFYYLPDQDPGGSPAVFAPFFGHPAATVTALGRMARLSGAQVVPCFTRILPFGRGYEIVFQPPLEGFPTGDAAADTRRMNAVIEDGVRAMPEQYMWTYKRFKQQPEGAASPYD